MRKRKFHRSDYDPNELRRYIVLSPEQKFDYLEALNEFFAKSMPARSKNIWKVLKSRGW